ncbi:MAG: 2-iminoacetate synthase ThiH [Desulfotalea sp.]
MFTPPNIADSIDKIASSTSEDIEQILKTGRCSLEQFPALLSEKAAQYLPQLSEISSQISLQRFGKTMQLYAPLYVSNFCANKCVYCGFAANNQITRKCLSPDEVDSEAEILYARGFRHILLVTGEAEAKVNAKDLADIAIRLKNKFSSISIEVQPFDTNDYTLLFESGITSVAVYQETYDRTLYSKLHLGGKKMDYDYRLATPARACEAGMREIGIGALLGLGNWRYEALCLASHLSWLRKNYWRSNFTVSFPRMRPASGGFEPEHPMDTRELCQLVFALRILDPDVGLLISTREEETFRDGMVGLGPTRYSAGSSTQPGGYGDPDVAGEQWDVGDHRSVEEVAKMLKDKGFDTVYKDWDPSFQATN